MAGVYQDTVTGGDFEDVQYAAITGPTTTITVPKNALYMSIYGAGTFRLSKTSASATGAPFAATTWYNNIPVGKIADSATNTLFVNETSATDGVGIINVIFIVGT